MRLQWMGIARDGTENPSFEIARFVIPKDGKNIERKMSVMCAHSTSFVFLDIYYIYIYLVYSSRCLVFEGSDFCCFGCSQI